jgi:glycosyltransferase involved in cell wall biosynthesis
MKVIYLHQYFNTPKMIGGVRSYDISKHLVDRGHQVEMVTTNRTISDIRGWKTTNEDGIDVHWFSLYYSNKLSYMKRLLSFFLFAFYAAKKGSKIQGDVVFASSTPLTIAIPAIFISWKKSIPLVFEVRDLWPDVPIAVGAIKNPIIKFCAKALEKLAYRKSSAVIALSQGMKNGILENEIDENKIFVIPNFSNIELFNSNIDNKLFISRREWLKGSPLLVYTGTFGMINGVSYLVDISEQLLLSNSDIKVLLLGDGKELDMVRYYAKKKNVLNNNLYIEPSVRKQDLPSVLAAASLASNIVIDEPAVWNNSANKFFDALASGTPVLINSGGWQADLVRKHKIGIVTYGLSIELAAEKIHNFLHNKIALKESSFNALKVSKKYFDKVNLVKEVEKVLYLSVKD